MIKITVGRIKEQNVGWDEFGTYDVKGLTLHRYGTNKQMWHIIAI